MSREKGERGRKVKWKGELAVGSNKGRWGASRQMATVDEMHQQAALGPPGRHLNVLSVAGRDAVTLSLSGPAEASEIRGATMIGQEEGTVHWLH
jgi:hypothetical protein